MQQGKYKTKFHLDEISKWRLGKKQTSQKQQNNRKYYKPLKYQHWILMVSIIQSQDIKWQIGLKSKAQTFIDYKK
jgi:hypothetical protein